MKRLFIQILIVLFIVPHVKSEIGLVDDDAQVSWQIYAGYLKANYLHMKGRIPEAFKVYQHILEKNPPAYAYDGYLHLLFDVGQFRSIVGLYEQKALILQPAFKDNLEIKLIIAQAYLNTNQEEKAEKLFNELAQKYPDNEQVAYYKMVSLMQNKQPDQALEFIDECLKKPILYQKYFLFYFLKSKILLQKKQPEQAMAMIEKSIALFPRFDRGWLLKSILLEQQGKINDAISGYKKFLSIVGSEQEIEKKVVQLLFLKKRFAEAAHYLKNIKSTQPEYQFNLALIEFKAEHYDQALALIDACLAQVPAHKQAKYLKVDILLAKKSPHDALAFLQRCLAENVHDNEIIHTMLLLRRSGVSCSALIKSIELVNKNSDQSPELLSALADLYIELGEYQRGAVYYKKVFNITDNHMLKSKIIYHLAYIYFTTNMYPALDDLIGKAFKFNLVGADLYNLIAFYYAQTNQKLEQALNFVEKALAVDGQSPYYLDTKGLILIKLGEPSKGGELLKSAHEQAPGDDTIIEHMKLANI